MPEAVKTFFRRVDGLSADSWNRTSGSWAYICSSGMIRPGAIHLQVTHIEAFQFVVKARWINAYWIWADSQTEQVVARMPHTRRTEE